LLITVIRAGSLLKQEHKVLGDAVVVEPAVWPVSNRFTSCLIMLYQSVCNTCYYYQFCNVFVYTYSVKEHVNH